MEPWICAGIGHKGPLLADRDTVAGKNQRRSGFRKLGFRKSGFSEFSPCILFLIMLAGKKPSDMCDRARRSIDLPSADNEGTQRDAKSSLGARHLVVR